MFEEFIPLSGDRHYGEDIESTSICPIPSIEEQDALNIIRSDFEVQNSVFSQNQFDAIDVDYSRGFIKDSQFYFSGNDAIDFSGSNVYLEGIKITHTKDKAISIGESSNIEGHNIGLWQNTQKHRFKIGKLSNDRINKLKKIDFIFEKVLDVKWDNCFEASKKFYQLNGYANCKFHYVVDGITLGRWQARQRENYRKNRLTQEQIDKLKSIEFVFEGNYYKLRQNESTWNKYYESSKSFLNEYGNANCKNRTIYQGLKLGLWQNSQRAYYNSGKLSKERVDKLEKIGFLWSLPHGGSKEWRKWKSKLGSESERKYENRRLDSESERRTSF